MHINSIQTDTQREVHETSERKYLIRKNKKKFTIRYQVEFTCIEISKEKRQPKRIKNMIVKIVQRKIVIGNHSQ